jgi:hypothetical protein
MSTTFTSISNDPLRQVGVIETLTGATTLTAEDSGKVFILNAAAGTIGDFVELVGDGTNWYVFGLGTSAGAITLTVV